MGAAADVSRADSNPPVLLPTSARGRRAAPARRRFNLVEFMMHDKDCGGTIDVDECMEILFRRFGKDALEAKVNDFMSNDEDKDQTISFSEFLNMDRRNDKAGTRHHKGQLAPHTRRSLTSVGRVSEGAPSSAHACLPRLRRFQAHGRHPRDHEERKREAIQGTPGHEMRCRTLQRVL